MVFFRCRSLLRYGTALQGVVLAVGLVAFGFVWTSKAQSAAEETRAAVYRYARPGQETMQVGVWGSVSQPGLYEVPPDTDLPNLLSIAGGPEVSLEDPRSKQTITIRVARGRGSATAARPPSSGVGQRRVIFEAPLEEISDFSQPLPDLQSGDVLTVEKIVSERLGWRDVLSMFQAVGTVAIIGLNIIRLSQN